MGAGKSTIGRLLAQELKKQFMDSDRVIEERAGANIPWIFDVEGEKGFRDREQSVIEFLAEQKGIVLATGGGVVLREENRQRLKEGGLVIYLQTSVDQQIERTCRDKNRPLLQTENPRQTLETLLATRDPLYRDCCDLIVRTDGRHPRAVVSEIVRHLNKQQPFKSSVHV